MQTNANSMDRWTVILSAIAVSAIGALFYNLLPIYLGTAQDSKGLTTAQLGFISSAFFLGYNVATISAFYWIRRFNWRMITLAALPAAAAGLYASTLAESYWLMLLATACAGAAFSVVYGIGTIILSDTSNPTRWFGLKIAAEAGLGAVLFIILPSTLIEAYGFTGLILGILLTMLVLAPVLLLLPAAGSKTHELEQAEFHGYNDMPESINHWTIWSALFSTLIFFAGVSAVWAFLERFGIDRGFDSEEVAVVLAVTLGFATMGSLGAAAMGKRFGNANPFLASCVLICLSLIVLFVASSLSIYSVGACLFAFAFGAGLPFAVAQVAELDVDGRYAILTVPAVGIGAMIGPGVAGMFYGIDNPGVILVAVSAAMFVAGGLMFTARKQ